MSLWISEYTVLPPPWIVLLEFDQYLVIYIFSVLHRSRISAINNLIITYICANDKEL
jgi:hypothetical protein